MHHARTQQAGSNTHSTVLHGDAVQVVWCAVPYAKTSQAESPADASVQMQGSHVGPSRAVNSCILLQSRASEVHCANLRLDAYA
jgi:hypothetical protein